jgi:glycosyltransferase involved in cell wall biosynthesis
MSKIVSVVIPCYKQKQWVEAAMQSAQAAHVHVYDEDEDPFRAGVCYARNFLIVYANDKLILPLDADDTLYPDAIERLYAAWQPGIWVYGNHTEVDEDGNVLREVIAPPAGMLPIKNLTYATFLFHKDDWQRVGGYDPTFEIGCEDYAFQIALAANGVRPVKLDGAPIYKRMIHPQSRTSTAVEHFPVLQRLMKRKWPSVFVNH